MNLDELGSTETGTWASKSLLSSHFVNYTGFYSHVYLNGMLYLWERELGLKVDSDSNKIILKPSLPLRGFDFGLCFLLSGYYFNNGSS